MKLSRIFKTKKATKKLVKFVAGDLNNPEIEFNYGKIFEQSDNSIKIATSKNQIELLSDLLNDLEPPFYILYVLVVSRIGQKLGRYQSPIFETKKELTKFLNQYRKYFETDARHHIWIGTVENTGLLVYDQHNVIFAYGNVENYRNRLNKNKYKEQNFTFPVPHGHLYHEENDKYERSILKEFDWEIFPLQENDIYDE
ncbi:hypothetical protein F7018_05400 [Tenacibaculum aiptasiae]|uniref:Uncharacterized protein n=1 Tax=Tenacibaculum aiptasiae TaxID=426481 RepID=A0A7J5AQ52_9FLAO|nr:hypothetical protein [Tenacibaculum aiptasiae]KAB1159745.1 hypothetical protein F7018_05400 [Tenacibaculum aiptasiae]